GQRVVADAHRLELAQQAVGAGGHAADAAVGLVGPVVEAGALGQVVGLVGEARTQAARVGLLQADDVVLRGQFGDRIQAGALAPGRQRVRPAAGHVVAVAAGAGAGLDVGRQHPQPARGRRAGLQHGAPRLAGCQLGEGRRVHARNHRGAQRAPPRSCATSHSAVASIFSKPYWSALIVYLPATTSAGVPSMRARAANWRARLSLASTPKLLKVSAKRLASTPYWA